MADRQEHQQEVHNFLHKYFADHDWLFSHPGGSGSESYIVHGNEHVYFVKVGVPVERYMVMAQIGLTPPILAHGRLESGLSIFVQPLIRGRNPSRRDFQNQLEKVALMIHDMHSDPNVKGILTQPSSNLYKDMGLDALKHLRQRWEHYRVWVPDLAPFIDKSLEELAIQIHQFSGEGLAACHNDICNANWLFASDGKIYIVDLDSMSMDDPALDVGALLWWYYPPQQRRLFLNITGYPYDVEFKFRMRVRMAMHCLSILLPREQSFDKFDPGHFHTSLTDFRAILDGKENPQGYAA